MNDEHYVSSWFSFVLPDDLKELITVCHGTVVSHPDKFSDDKLSLVVTCKDMDGDEGSESRSSQDINVFNSKL